MSFRTRFRRFRLALVRLYYRVKYFPFARERRQRASDGARGFIVIQLDALSHDDLGRAIRQGYAPNIRRLIHRSGWQLRRYPAGLPSATPAAQAAIFYGTKDGIPAFRFYERTHQRMIVCSRPADVQFVRDRLPESGILRNGSSYTNIFDGGADRAAFTFAARQPQPVFEKMGGARLLLLSLLHPIRMVRMVLASLWEYLLEEWNRLISQFRGHSTHYWWYLPILHIGTNVVLRELQTLAVLLDIYVGVPAIYTTYNSYDEYAHHFGPRSRPAMASIRALDRRVGDILRMVRRLPGRPYDVWILSDHGQTPSTPYRVEFGETLGDTIITAVRHGVHVAARAGTLAPEAGDAMAYLVRELEEVAAGSTHPVRLAMLRVARWLRSQYGLFPLVAEVVREATDARIVVTYSSSLAHLYWTDSPSPLGHDEILADTEHRRLYLFLVAHRGIGLVLTRSEDGVIAAAPRGTVFLSANGDARLISGENPVERYATMGRERAEIVRLVRLHNAGDVVLFGAWDPVRNQCICFDDQVGAHGAMGGAQYWPFILSAPGLIPEDHEIADPLDIHPLFRRYGG
ncbi:MAG: alkaline phosphatase family protein [Gemmatimonadetes bacterium]|nr:alkaline phosphatase family protein [Gemmatimonadota bacterium]